MEIEYRLFPNEASKETPISLILETQLDDHETITGLYYEDDVWFIVDVDDIQSDPNNIAPFFSEVNIYRIS